MFDTGVFDDYYDKCILGAGCRSVDLIYRFWRKIFFYRGFLLMTCKDIESIVFHKSQEHNILSGCVGSLYLRPWMNLRIIKSICDQIVIHWFGCGVPQLLGST